MFFIGSEVCRCASGDIVGVFDVGKVCIPVILMFVANHGLYFGHGVVDTCDAAVTTRGVGACREFVYTEKFLNTPFADWAQTWSPLSDRRVDGHPQRRIKRLTKLLAVSSAINSADVTVNTSARRLKRSVKRRM